MEEKNNNKSTGKIAVIVVLAVLLIGAVGYICYDKFLKGDSLTVDNAIKNDSKKGINGGIKKLTKDSPEIEGLMSTFVYKYNCDDQSYLSSLNEKESKLYMAYSRAHYLQSMSCNKVENLVYNTETCGTLDYTEMDSYFDMNTGKLIVNDKLKETLRERMANFVSKFEFDKKMKELFGKNIEYSYDDITLMMGCHSAHYDQKLEKYIEYTGYNCGGTCGGTKEVLKDISQDKDKLTLVVDFAINEDTPKEVKYNFKYEDDHYIFVNME